MSRSRFCMKQSDRILHCLSRQQYGTCDCAHTTLSSNIVPLVSYLIRNPKPIRQETWDSDCHTTTYMRRNSDNLRPSIIGGQ